MRIVSSIRSLLFALVMLTMASAAFGQIGIAITIAPPALPVYEQPVCPGDGYIWTPGYWAYDYDFGDYYWVPGTWVEAPEVGFLWTPPYWGWGGDAFIFHEGFWGTEVGFYGGINYGFGYFGDGFEGGRWDNGHFFYNRSVTNVNVTNIHNVYNTTIVNRNVENRVSYNGGNGGIEARPTPQQEAAANGRHIPPVAAQNQHVQAARSNQQLRASVNQGKPPIAATAKPADFHQGVVPARQAGAPYHAQPARGNASAPRPENTTASHQGNNVPRPTTATHAKDLAPHEHLPAPNTGNAKQDQKYQQQQEKLYAQQEKDHQKLVASQEKDHQRMAQQKASEAKTQQMEQKHQQQTQQMEQKHAQQQQHLQQKQQPAPHNAAPRPPK